MGSTTHVDRPPVADPLDRGVSPGGPTRRMLGQAGIGSAQKRTHDCARPIRLKGSTRLVNRTTGEVRTVYASSQELEGSAWVPCGNRRAAACEPCSERYKGDAWQLITTGLAGGKGIPASVAGHPCTFATLTAPSFGPVHGLRSKGPCRARRDKPVCAHGRPLWCNRRHRDGDPVLGTPLCQRPPSARRPARCTSTPPRSPTARCCGCTGAARSMPAPSPRAPTGTAARPGW